MAAATPEKEPESFYVGDTVKWIKDVTDYTPDDGWTLTYAFVPDFDGGTATTVDATDNGDYRHLLTIAAADCASDFAAGHWKWTSYVTKSAERYVTGMGTVLVKVNPAVPGTDARSHVKTVLDSICAVLEGKATKDQESTSVGDRALSRYSWSELLGLKDKYERLYKDELAAEKMARGESAGRTPRVRF